MSTQHTPGPWGIIRGDAGPIIFSGDKGVMVAQAIRRVTTVERDANARLIAAAPQLLEELKRVREVIAASNQTFIEGATNNATGLIDDAEDLLIAEADQDLLNGIDAVIAKATGSSA